MKIRISLQDISAKLFIVVLSAYSFSQMSLGNAIPIKTWFMLIAVVGFAALIMSISKSLRRYRYYTMDEVTFFGMAFIVLFWNNYNLKYQNWGYEAIFIVLFILYLILKRKSNWYEFAFNIIFGVSIFYALITILCLVLPSLYDNVVYPLIASYNTMYTKTYMAGFTSHYSTNGMYLALGLCVAICYFFFEERKHKLLILLAMLLVLAALMVSGKRGPVVCLAFAFVVTYYIYNGNKPLSRVFKIAALLVLAITGLSIAANFVPELMNVLNRFITQIQKGDITTQRVNIWAQAIPAFFEKPLWGNGWCWFRYHNTYGVEYHVHNCYLQWLTEVGIIGSIPFFAFTVMSLSRAISLLWMQRKQKIDLPAHYDKWLALAVFYQTFFIPFCFQGTGFYEVQVLFPYILVCAFTNQIWGTYVTRKKQNVLRGSKE